MSTMRGLRNFIVEIRGARNADGETDIIKKELAKIRGVFNKKSDSYSRRKYVLKLMYMYILGHDFSFGVLEAVELMASKDKNEKIVGYLFLSAVLREDSEFLTLVCQTLMSDISGSSLFAPSLALNFVANIASPSIAEVVAPKIVELLSAERGSVHTVVRKKAALCMLTLVRRAPEAVSFDTLPSTLIDLIDTRNVGFLTCLMSLLQEAVTRDPLAYIPAVPKIVHLMAKISLNREVAQDHFYCGYPCPWLLIKLMAVLLVLPPPQVGSQPHSDILRVVGHVSHIVDVSATGNKLNTQFAVFLQAVRLAVHVGQCEMLLLPPEDVMTGGVPAEGETTTLSSHRHSARLSEGSPDDRSILSIAGKALSSRNANLVYFALDTLCMLARSTPAVGSYHGTVSSLLLSSQDASIVRRAADFLFLVASARTARALVEELLAYLEGAGVDAVDTVRYVALRVGVLLERFIPDDTPSLSFCVWYCDALARLLGALGDQVEDILWFRACEVVASFPHTGKRYAAYRLCRQVLAADDCRSGSLDSLDALAVFLLGEYGGLLFQPVSSSDLPGYSVSGLETDPVSLQDVASLLIRVLSAPTSVDVLSPLQPVAVEAIGKIIASSSDRDSDSVMGVLRGLLETASRSIHPEAAQRASELLTILNLAPELVSTLLAPLPPRDIHCGSALQDRLEKQLGREGVETPDDVDTEEAESPRQEMEVEMPPQVSSVRPSSLLDLVSEPASTPLPIPPGVYTGVGVLYEGTHLQIGVRSETGTDGCRMEVFFGNKSGSMLSITAAVDFVPGPQEPASALEIRCSTLPSSLGPNQQARMTVHALAKAPYVSLPTLTVLLDKRRICMFLPLPISRCLCAPSAEIAEDVDMNFVTHWDALGPKLERAMVSTMETVSPRVIGQVGVALGLTPLKGIARQLRKAVFLVCLPNAPSVSSRGFVLLMVGPKGQGQIEIVARGHKAVRNNVLEVLVKALE
ncbi:hypothetical protein KIPB_010048 [Kipferlia bialata]|uniref:AP-2 complex subunit alpha n=1 Tax=Kipferlia bialata TaxID=797122 RepID=A0A391NPA5_9EUKA|nr:hypothetical protein KIPB_010048 [Kipferlia bialata]|eukprot:g10048.t1